MLVVFVCLFMFIWLKQGKNHTYFLDFLGFSRYLSQSSPAIGIDWNDRSIFFDFLRTISPRRCQTDCQLVLLEAITVIYK